jgi:hypothetical protein
LMISMTRIQWKSFIHIERFTVAYHDFICYV